MNDRKKNELLRVDELQKQSRKTKMQRAFVALLSICVSERGVVHPQEVMKQEMMIQWWHGNHGGRGG